MIKLIVPFVLLLMLQPCSAQQREARMIVLPKRMLTVKEAITALERNGYSVYYNNKELNDARTITVPSDSIEISKLLDIIIEGTSLEYLLKKNQVIFRRTTASLHDKRNVILSGYVRNSNTFENLIGATVMNAQSHQGAATNQYGFFSIAIPERTPVDLLFSYAGHSASFISGVFNRDTLVQVWLSDENLLDTVVIQEQRYPFSQPYKVITQSGVAREEKVPFLGEPDLFKVIQRSPGVQQGADGTASLYVRGGDAGTNLVLLDGAPVYFTSHMLNLFSVFSPQAVNEVKFYKGYIPGRYGGRLSSVLDVSLREGNTKELTGEASIGLISSQFILEGPIVKEKASFIISARRTYLDIPAYFIQKATDDEEFYNYNFYDITLKTNLIPTARDRIYLSSYLGRDYYTFEENTDFTQSSGPSPEVHTRDFHEHNKWRNTTFTGRWNHIFNERTFSNFLITFSNFANEGVVQYSNRLETTDTNGSPSVQRSSSYDRQRSSLITWGTRIDLEQSAGYNHYFRYGLSLHAHNIQPEARTLERDGSTVVPFTPAGITGQEMSMYVQDSWALADKLSLDLGFHLGYYYASRSFWQPQPRVSITFQPRRSSFTLSYMKQAQFITPLTSQTLELATDSWFSAGYYKGAQRTFKPLTSDEINFVWKLSVNSDLTVSSNVFYKQMNNLIAFIPGRQYLYKGDVLPDLLMTGKGRSYGWESEGAWVRGTSSFDASYTLSWNNRQFAEVNNGKAFPFHYDRRHTLRLGWQKKWQREKDKYWQLSAQWFVASGAKVTVPVASYETVDIISPNDRATPVYRDMNNFRLPVNHRLDVGVNFFKRKARGSRMWQAGAYNVYNRRNPSYLDMYEGPDHKKYLDYERGLPVLPYIRYTRSF